MSHTHVSVICGRSIEEGWRFIRHLEGATHINALFIPYTCNFHHDDGVDPVIRTGMPGYIQHYKAHHMARSKHGPRAEAKHEKDEDQAVTAEAALDKMDEGLDGAPLSDQAS